MSTENEYVPYGPEWVKELTKHSKVQLIDLYRRQILFSNNQTSEIEALNKEIDILRKYKSLSEEILSKIPCDNGDIHQSNLYLFGFKNAVRELKEFKQANKL
jgi:hypothetical protein